MSKTTEYIDEIEQAATEETIAVLVLQAFRDKYVRKTHPDINFVILGATVKKQFPDNGDEVVKRICRNIHTMYASKIRPVRPFTASTFTWTFNSTNVHGAQTNDTGNT